MTNTPAQSVGQADIVLVGAGIMSATLAVILKELDPALKIEIFEVLGSAAQESSNAWNNAGTGHAALCELNYTPEESDGSRRHLEGAGGSIPQFSDLSRQLLVVNSGKDGMIAIKAIPKHSSILRYRHMSFGTRRKADVAAAF